MHLRKAGARLAVLVALAAAVTAMTASLAYAGPTEPTLDVTHLQQAIDANGGSLAGKMKTVVKGSDVVELDVTVTSVVTGFSSGPVDMSSLIMFESDDPRIVDRGGIAAGMSGSPIYVDYGEGPKLIGAVSYGESDSLNGVGFATPIAAMESIQSDWIANGMPRRLASPVVIDGEVKTRMIVTQDGDAASKAPADTIVAEPLSAVFVGGMNPKSRMYKSYSKLLEAGGTDVIGTQGGLSSKESTYNAPFTAGSAVSVLAARGDMWAGGVGTVTYVDSTSGTDTVLAFGHSAFWAGDTGLYMCNAWVDGIFPSSYEPYKLARPAAVRGILAQDRTAGILGVDGEFTPETPVTATAVRGSKVATSATYLPRVVANDSDGEYYGLAAVGTYVAGSRLFDAYTIPGSAVTTTTVTVLDESDDSVRTLVRRNLYSDGSDISMAVVTDVDDIVSSIQGANGNGIAHAQVLAVDLQSSFSAQRKEAEIVDITVDGGLKAGDNTVTVSFAQYGVQATQTVDVPLHIPDSEWALTTGSLSVSAVNNSGGGDYSDELFREYDFDDNESGVDRRTVKDVLSELDKAVDNTVISVSFQPEWMMAEDSEIEDLPRFAAIETTAATDWVVSGYATKVSPALDAESLDGTHLSYGEQVRVNGTIVGVDDDGLVEVSGAGVTAETVEVIDGEFSYFTPQMFKKSTLNFEFRGNDSALPTAGTLTLYVYAKVTLGASTKTPTHGKSVTLTSRVRPADAGGTVSFQRLSGKSWKTMKKVAVPASGTVSYKYKPSKAGTVKVRARFNGSATNRAKSSSTVTLKVK